MLIREGDGGVLARCDLHIRFQVVVFNPRLQIHIHAAGLIQPDLQISILAWAVKVI